MAIFEIEEAQYFEELAEIQLIPPGNNSEDFDRLEIQAITRFGTQSINIGRIRTRSVEIALLQAEVKLELEACVVNRRDKLFSRTLEEHTDARETLLQKGGEHSSSNTGGGSFGVPKLVGLQAAKARAGKSSHSTSLSQKVDWSRKAEIVSAQPGMVWKIGTNVGDPRHPNGETPHLYGDDYLPQGDAVLCVVEPAEGAESYEVCAVLRAKVDQIGFFEKGEFLGAVEPNSTLAKKLVTLQARHKFSFEEGTAYVALGRSTLTATRVDKPDQNHEISPDFKQLLLSIELFRRLENTTNRSLANLARIAGKDPRIFWQGVDLKELRYIESDIAECELNANQLRDAVLLSEEQMTKYSEETSSFLVALARDQDRLTSEKFPNNASRHGFKSALELARKKFADD